MSDKTPTSVWRSYTFDEKWVLGVNYSDGSSEALFRIDPNNYRSPRELNDAVNAAYLRYGIEAPALIEGDRRREAMDAMDRALKDMLSNLRGPFYHTRSYGGDVPGYAFGGLMGARHQPPDPERIKAVVRCRSLKTLADHPTANLGERENARAAMARLKAKHGISDHEI